MNNLQPTITQTTEVRLQSDTEQQSEDDPGKSLIQEIAILRQQVQQLCQAVRSLVQLQSVANQKLDAVIRGNADCAVL